MTEPGGPADAAAGRWRELSELERSRIGNALENGRPVDEALVPAALDLQRSNKRSAVHLAWAGPLVLSALVSLGGAVLGPGDGDGGWPRAVQVALVTLPLAAVLCGTTAVWAFGTADRRERVLRRQLGDDPSPLSSASRVARSVARVGLALVMALVLTPLLLLPIRVLTILVGLLGVPIDELPDAVGLSFGGLAVVAVAVACHRWSRTSPSSPFAVDERDGRGPDEPAGGR